jgi:hypothetical protein
MKLLNCMACQDIVLLHDELRRCKCGRSAGRYTTAVLAEYSGPARIIGMRSIDYHTAQPGVQYPWWFMAESEHIRKVER